MSTAHLKGFIFYTWTDGPGSSAGGERTEMLEQSIEVENLRTSGPRAQVAQQINTKVSDSLMWGDGTWDKIPYSVEISAAVTLECDQEEDTIVRAQNLANDLAWKATRRHLGAAVVKHCDYIKKRLYSELFEGE